MPKHRAEIRVVVEYDDLSNIVLLHADLLETGRRARSLYSTEALWVLDGQEVAECGALLADELRYGAGRVARREPQLW